MLPVKLPPSIIRQPYSTVHSNNFNLYTVILVTFLAWLRFVSIRFVQNFDLAVKSVNHSFIAP
jgi:hypothetical protein